MCDAISFLGEGVATLDSYRFLTGASFQNISDEDIKETFLDQQCIGVIFRNS